MLMRRFVLAAARQQFGEQQAGVLVLRILFEHATKARQRALDVAGHRQFDTEQERLQRGSLSDLFRDASPSQQQQPDQRGGDRRHDELDQRRFGDECRHP